MLDIEYFQQILNETQDVVIITRADTLDPPGPEIVYVNKAFTELTGYSAEEAIGNSPRMLQSSKTDIFTKQQIRRALEQKEPVRVTIKNVSRHGKHYWLDLSIVPLRNAKNRVTHFAAIQRDVTEQKKYERYLERQTITDPLTGLLNRRGFDDVMCREMARFDRTRSPFSLLTFDIDHFKRINDIHGHETGDKVLREIGDFCKQFARINDYAVRLGGEEFGFVLGDVTEWEAFLIAERLRNEVSKLAILPDDSMDTVKVTISVGVAECDAKKKEGDDLLSFADMAMNEAKNAGRNCSRLYSSLASHEIA